jgi:hypothetical protein
MNRTFYLRYVLVTSLLMAILGIAASPIICSDVANAAEEKQLSKTKKRIKYSRYELRKYARLKAAKKAGKTGKIKPFFPLCDWFDDDC